VVEAAEGRRLIALTTHRRESLGRTMRGNLAVLRRFVEAHDDTALVFPVHPNPSVVAAARSELQGHPRIHLLEPLGYHDFIHLLSRSWLIVSDSGGVQEEAPTLGRPVLILRENTERPEAVDAGVARLVGKDPARLAALLDELSSDPSWIESVATIENPFGRGDSATRIVSVVAELLGVETPDITLGANSAA
jgi:UDP-N-acetylglucosamine 2-epimerase (non-hydrolysing)